MRRSLSNKQVFPFSFLPSQKGGTVALFHLPILATQPFLELQLSAQILPISDIQPLLCPFFARIRCFSPHTSRNDTGIDRSRNGLDPLGGWGPEENSSVKLSVIRS